MAFKVYSKTKLAAVAAASAFALLSGSGVALAQTASMPLGQTTMAPHGFLQFCQDQPRQCGMSPAAGAASPAADTTKRLMQAQWAKVFGLAPAATTAVAAPDQDAEKQLMQKQWAGIFGIAPPALEAQAGGSQTNAASTAPASTVQLARAPAALQPASPVADNTEPAAPSVAVEPPTPRFVSRGLAALSSFQSAYDFSAPQPSPLSDAAPLEAGALTPVLVEAADRSGSDAFNTSLAADQAFLPPAPYALATELYVQPVLTTPPGDTPVQADVAPTSGSVDGSDTMDEASAAPQSDLASPAADDTAEVAPLRLDNPLLEQLTLVNAHVNAAITPMSDVEAFGENDVWTLPLENGGPARGNCKHYALEKQHALIAAGVPAADLSLAIVKTSWGEMHAVLLVSTDRGELVLDNLTGAVMSWRDVNYIWLERQKPGEPLTWVTVAQANGSGARG